MSLVCFLTDVKRIEAFVSLPTFLAMPGNIHTEGITNFNYNSGSGFSDNFFL